MQRRRLRPTATGLRDRAPLPIAGSVHRSWCRATARARARGRDSVWVTWSLLHRFPILLALVAGSFSCTSNRSIPPPQSVDGGTATPIRTAEPSTVGLPSAPSSRPGAPAIRISELRGSVAYDCGNDVCEADIDGSNVHALTHRRGPEFDPTWSPDGTRIAYRDSRSGIHHKDQIY